MDNLFGGKISSGAFAEANGTLVGVGAFWFWLEGDVAVDLGSDEVVVSGDASRRTVFLGPWLQVSCVLVALRCFAEPLVPVLII